MAIVKTITSSMPRGDSRSLTLSVPKTLYTTGASIFFALKTAIDNVLDDSSAALKKTLTDSNISSTDATNVYYILNLLPTDTTGITPAIYFAEFEYVSSDKSVVESFPDPSVAVWKFTITGDVNRRTS